MKKTGKMQQRKTMKPNIDETYNLHLLQNLVIFKKIILLRSSVPYLSHLALIEVILLHYESAVQNPFQQSGKRKGRLIRAGHLDICLAGVHDND